MPENTIRFDRLLTLAEWLDRPQEELANDRFTFRAVVCRDGCGTAGCALGELPGAFPREWVFVPGRFLDVACVSAPRYDESDDDAFGRASYANAGWYFGLDAQEADHLFSPSHQDERYGSSVQLDGSATKEQVAANIRAFVAKMRADALESSETREAGR